MILNIYNKDTLEIIGRPVWGADNGRFNILKGSATYYSKI